jgi:hypothetical protein
MIKLTFKDAKDFAVLATIESAKDYVLPFRFNYWMLKIYRALKREVDEVEDSLRNLIKEYVLLEDNGSVKIIPAVTETQADGSVKEITPAKPFEWKSPTAQEEHRVAFNAKAGEALHIVFKFPDIDPISFESLEGKDLPLSFLAGIEPLTDEWQRDHDEEKRA